MTSESPSPRVANSFTADHADLTSAPLTIDFRLRFANRIVEESWRDRKAIWTREDVGILLLDVLEEELSFDWSQPEAVDDFKEFLSLAYIAAGDVLPATQRTF